MANAPSDEPLHGSAGGGHAGKLCVAGCGSGQGPRSMGSIDLPVVGREIDALPGWLHNVVVVDRGETVDGHDAQVPGTVEVESSHRATTVEQQRSAIRRPVGCLQQDSVGRKHQRGRAVEVSDPYLGALEAARRHRVVAGLGRV